MEAYSHRHNQSFHPSLSPNPPQTFSAFQTPPGLSIDDAGYPLSLVTPPHSAPAASPQFNIPSTLLYDSRRRRMQQFSSSRQQETYGAGYGRHGSMHDNMQNALPCGCDPTCHHPTEECPCSRIEYAPQTTRRPNASEFVAHHHRQATYHGSNYQNPQTPSSSFAEAYEYPGSLHGQTPIPVPGSYSKVSYSRPLTLSQEYGADYWFPRNTGPVIPVTYFPLRKRSLWKPCTWF